MIDYRGEITPNMRVQKLAQYDRLTDKAMELARQLKENKGKPFQRTFVNADGELTGLQITPRFVWGMYRTRDRSFRDYKLT